MKLLILFLLITVTLPGEDPPKEYVTATVYQGVRSQTDDTPHMTATGDVFNPIRPPRWIAVSRDLLSKFPYNSKVCVKGAGVHDGIFVVKDTMAERMRKKIDILIPLAAGPGHPKYGKWSRVLITKLN